jgi:8-oxo-dGTP diphosphatase
MDKLLAGLWRAMGPFQGWLAWMLHATFNVGVTGIVRADDGRVLLLRHRFWPEDRQWGFPGGFAKRDEQFSETVVREVREETGLTVTVGPLLEVRAGDRYRAEVYYEASIVGGLDGLMLQGSEILDARLFTLDSMPAAMPPLHRQFAMRGAKSA